MPFGLTAQEKNAWFEYGGGQEIADKVYAKLGCKFFPGGSTGAQMGGWFNKEINSISDLKGLKIRIGGPGAEVLKALGAEVISFPLTKAPQALKSGKLDAVELVGPALDMAAEIHKFAKYYYYPCWHEPGGVFDLFINKTKWDSLSPSLKAVVKGAATCLNYNVLSSNLARNSAALNSLVEEQGVQLRQFPNEVLQKFRQVFDQMIQKKVSEDELTREVLTSIWQFKKQAVGWSKVSMQPYLSARNEA
jgi:TRAP-type mannitol/chloroaromatic compound transport system substrate-binding protein